MVFRYPSSTAAEPAGHPQPRTDPPEAATHRTRRHGGAVAGVVAPAGGPRRVAGSPRRRTAVGRPVPSRCRRASRWSTRCSPSAAAAACFRVRSTAPAATSCRYSTTRESSSTVPAKSDAAWKSHKRRVPGRRRTHLPEHRQGVSPHRPHRAAPECPAGAGRPGPSPRTAMKSLTVSMKLKLLTSSDIFGSPDTLATSASRFVPDTDAARSRHRRVCHAHPTRRASGPPSRRRRSPVPPIAGGAAAPLPVATSRPDPACGAPHAARRTRAARAAHGRTCTCPPAAPVPDPPSRVTRTKPHPLKPIRGSRPARVPECN